MTPSSGRGQRGGDEAKRPPARHSRRTVRHCRGVPTTLLPWVILVGIAVWYQYRSVSSPLFLAIEWEQESRVLLWYSLNHGRQPSDRPETVNARGSTMSTILDRNESIPAVTTSQSARTRTNQTLSTPPFVHGNGELDTITNTTVDANGDIVISWNGLHDMDAFVNSIWKGNLFCDTILEARNVSVSAMVGPKPFTVVPTARPVTVHITFGCHELFHRSATGTGNYILAWYMMRLSASFLGRIQIHFTCPDANDMQRRLILPWFTGHWSSHESEQPDDATVQLRAVHVAATRRTVANATPAFTQRTHRTALAPAKQACCPFWCTSLGPMLAEIQYDLRRMAIALVGVVPNHPSTVYAHEHLRRPYHVTSASGTENRTAWFRPHLAATTPLSRVALDDAVIHFRCGDVLNTNITSYGFLSFDGYARHISWAARTVGILTQPFDASPLHRSHDSDQETLRRCRVLVTGLQTYVQDRLGRHATVTIRNDPHETIALTYARMVMANQSIGAMSTFSVFPIVATFGTGYFLKPNRGSPNVWLRKLDKDLKRLGKEGHARTSNFVLFNETRVLVGSQTNELWDAKGDDGVLEWFRS